MHGPIQGMRVPGAPSLGDFRPGHDSFFVGNTAQAPAPASPAWSFFANVNFQGMDGGSAYPGSAGTDYFVASSSDLSYVKARASGTARVPFLWERLQPSLNGALDQTYLAELKSIADAALAQGTTVFFDCHNYMRRPVFSQTATAPYTISGWHGVDNPDGIVTRAHLVDMWTKLATYFASHAGVAGWDLMNEPTSDNHFGASSSSSDLAAIMQAVVNAIDAVETTKTIFVEGNSYSSAANWVSNNTSYPLTDAHDRIVYSAHCYPDYDASGSHFDWATFQANSEALTVLVDRSTGFVGWCSSHSVRGHIGETNVGIDNAGWNTVLDNGLTYWKANNIPVNLWLFGANFGSNPYNLYPYSGSQALQWAVVQKATAVGTPSASLFGPSNGPNGSASAAFTISLQGYLAALKTYTPSSTTPGTFSPASVTIPAGFNPANATFTFTPSSAASGTITVSDGTTTSAGIAFSSDPVNLITSLVAAAPKYSDWSQSNGGIATNTTFVTDETGSTHTAARITDNGAASQHTFNSPQIKVVPGCSFMVEMHLQPAGANHIQIAMQGSSSSVSVNVDLANNAIEAGSTSGGGVLLDGVVTAGSNGYKVVKFIGELASADTVANLWLYMLDSSYSKTYAGAGSDVYVDKCAVDFAPVGSAAGAPIATSLPTVGVTSGSPGVGGTYTVTPPAFVNGAPTGYTYRWLRDGTTAISGATAASYVAASADSGHTLVPEVTATNAHGSTVLLGASVSIGIAWTVASGNLITTQDPTNSAWTKVQGSGDVLTITPNYTAGGFAPDGQSYPTRVQIQSVSGYTSNIQFQVTHAAGFQSLFIRTNPVTGDGAAYINLRSSANGDHNINLNGSDLPLGEWTWQSQGAALNEPFMLLARPTSAVQDFLIWGERLEVGSSATPYAVSPSASLPASLSSISAIKRMFSAPDYASGTWPDKAASGRNLVNGSYAAPTLATNSLFGTGKSAVSTDTTYTQALVGDLSDLSGASAFAVFLTVDLNGMPAYGHIIDISGASGDDWNTDGAFMIQANSSGGGNLQVYTGGSAIATYTASLSTPYLMEFVFDGTNVAFWINGVSVGSIAATAALVAGAKLGLCVDSATGVQFASADARQIIITTGPLSTGNRQTIEGYLAWDATGDGSLLPTGHPYKGSAP